jgi:cob(I)alamin adenosyltransferase
MGKKRLPQGMIQVYTGNGKGKTTAALGLACRAVGHGYTVFMIQFMKGNIEYGELETARKLAPSLTIKQMGRECFVSRENPDPEDVSLAHEALALAKAAITSGEYDMVILDEINVAMNFGLISTQDVIKLMDEERPAHVELVLTGRYAPREIIEQADLVTEMAEIKHYYARGVQSREGIEK